MVIRVGTTRTVILVHQWAMKFPVVNHGWAHFLCGLLANMQERWISKITRFGPDSHKLSHVLLRVPLGLLIVMRRADALSSVEFACWRDNYNNFVEYERGLLPIEAKACSFGWLDGKVVGIDYGCTAEAFCLQRRGATQPRQDEPAEPSHTLRSPFKGPANGGPVHI